jgi:hypothetical protein
MLLPVTVSCIPALALCRSLGAVVFACRSIATTAGGYKAIEGINEQSTKYNRLRQPIVVLHRMAAAFAAAVLIITIEVVIDIESMMM